MCAPHLPNSSTTSPSNIFTQNPSHSRPITISPTLTKKDKRDVRPEQLAPVVVQNIQTKVREEIANQLYRIVQSLDAKNDQVTVTAKPETLPQPAGKNSAESPVPAQPFQQSSSADPKNDTPLATQQGTNNAPALPLTPRDGLDGLGNAIQAKVTGNIAHNGEHIANVVDSTEPIFALGPFGPGGPWDGLSGKPEKITP